ncbi:Lrp/AsnC family transcriptional regulator, partial [Peribacillus frigoritolerans]|uniref:Lrp/AsnC family transcriptional regulator n=1 Tax=Peribacillus frigoritolerans TaxID=450367 RepID=UPI0035E2A8A9
MWKQMKLTDIDKKILDILMINGRTSYADMGKELNISRNVVRDRVQQLIVKLSLVVI